MASWNPLGRKTHLHSGNKPQLTKGFIPYNEERQLEITHKDLMKLEESTRKLGKSVKKYHEGLKELQKIESKISSDIVNSPLCEDSDDFRTVSDSYQKTAYQMGHITEDLIQVTTKVMLEPMKKYQDEFEHVASAIKKRDSALNECLKYKTKIEKLEKLEKTAANVQKLEQMKEASDSAKEDFMTQNKTLLLELPSFYEQRIEYLEPCLEAFAQAQAHYYRESEKLFSQFVEKAADGDEDLLNEEKIQENYKKIMEEIKALDIVDASVL